MANQNSVNSSGQGFKLTVDGYSGFYSGYLIVRSRGGGIILHRQEELDRIRQVSNGIVGSPVPCRWLIDSVPFEGLQALESRLSIGERPRLYDVIRVDLRENPARLSGLLAALRARDDLVDFAYAELAMTLELAFTKPLPGGVRQLYLDAAPDGIGARRHWEEADLSHTRLVDIESAWSLYHEDVDKNILDLLTPMNAMCPECVNHGTSVLGVVAAKRNTLGGTGVAFGVPSVGLVSTWNPVDQSDLNVANAIIAAIDRWANMSDASVMLLEVQRDNPLTPTEVDWCDWHAIRCAIAHNMVVIECAGNGWTRVDLQSPQEPSSPGMMGSRIVGGIALKDSGAIMIGAGNSTTVYDVLTHVGLHDKSDGSNFGTRIDCYAWGDSIYTTGIGQTTKNPGPPLDKSYRQDFGGTSGAAAIIVGTALLIQGVAWRRKRAFLMPGELRRLLRSYGTGQRNPKTGLIGVMPDIELILNQI